MCVAVIITIKMDGGSDSGNSGFGCFWECRQGVSSSLPNFLPTMMNFQNSVGLRALGELYFEKSSTLAIFCMEKI